MYDAKADELTLFIPPIDPDSVIWMGLPMSLSEALKLYDVDRVLLTTDVNSALASTASSHGGKAIAFAIGEQVSEGTKFDGFGAINTSVLKAAIENTRVVKDGYEIAMLRKANDVSAQGHMAALRAAKTATNEREIEAAYIATSIANGCHEQAYHPVVASGESGGTLHYVRKDQDLSIPGTGERKENILIDAGSEYKTYCADITRVIPLNGKFSKETRQIYEIVLQMQLECIAMLKAGVLWEDVHTQAHRVAIKGLLAAGILRGSEDELLEKRISAAFFPHGMSGGNSNKRGYTNAMLRTWSLPRNGYPRHRRQPQLRRQG